MYEFVLLLLAIFFVGLTLVFPFAIIWALNILFGLSIACTFDTWLSVVILLFVLSCITGGVRLEKDN